eukprot:1964378-Rhodomonas_salina.1
MGGMKDAEAEVKEDVEAWKTSALRSSNMATPRARGSVGKLSSAREHAVTNTLPLPPRLRAESSERRSLR